MMPRKTLIFALSLILISIAQVQTYGQSDSTYTLRLSTARKLVHDALRSRVLDSIVTIQEQELAIANYEFGKLSNTVRGLTINHQQEIKLEQGKAEDYRQLSEVWRKNSEKKDKELKKEKRGKLVAKILVPVAAAVGLFLGSSL